MLLREEKLRSTYTAVGRENGAATWESSPANKRQLKRLNTELPRDPAILPVIYQDKWKHTSTRKLVHEY